MKSGIDYFPLDVNLDSKFELIEAQFGLKGFGVVVKLLQKIYGEQGYYLEWTDEIALLFNKWVGLDGNVVSDIVEASIKRGIFDKDLYDKYHILTSKGIQKRYFEAISRRKKIDVESAYLLIDVTQICGNVNIKHENVNISPENAYISKQSKVEKSKVEQSRERVKSHTQTVTKDQLIAEFGVDLVNAYLLKAESRNYTGQVGLNKAYEWLATDKACGRFNHQRGKLSKEGKATYDLDEFIEWNRNELYGKGGCK